MRKNKNYLERQNISENTKDALSPLIENKRKMRRMETILIWVVLIIGLIGALAMLWMYLGSRWG